MIASFNGSSKTLYIPDKAANYGAESGVLLSTPVCVNARGLMVFGERICS